MSGAGKSVYGLVFPKAVRPYMPELESVHG